MDLYEALNKVTKKKREYFLWKFKLNMYANDLTEEQILKKLELKSFASMKKWERTPEYKKLMLLYLDSKIANDLEEVYQVVKDKAITGDEKAIKLLLDLQKNVRTFNKELQTFHEGSDSNPLDELEL